MPTARLEFVLPEEQEEHHDAIHGARYRIALQDLDNWLRSKEKYENQESVTVEDARRVLREFLDDLPL